jgi:hypothetical protein
VVISKLNCDCSKPILTSGKPEAEKKEIFTMANSWALQNIMTGLVDHKSTRHDLPPIENAPEGMVWSHFNAYFSTKRNLPPSIKYSFNSAYGEAKQDADGDIRFDVKGVNPDDMLVVISVLENAIGCVKLNPTLGLPELRTFREKFEYIFYWWFPSLKK